MQFTGPFQKKLTQFKKKKKKLLTFKIIAIKIKTNSNLLKCWLTVML